MTDVIQINRLLEAAPFSSHLLIGALNSPQSVRSISQRFDALEPLVKIRVLIACLYVPDNSEQMREQMAKLISKGIRARESEWVRQVGSLVSCWLGLNLPDASGESPINFTQDLDATVKQCTANPAGVTLHNPEFWAIESCYLNPDLVPKKVGNYTENGGKAPFAVQASYTKMAIERDKKQKARREAAVKLVKSRSRAGAVGSSAITTNLPLPSFSSSASGSHGSRLSARPKMDQIMRPSKLRSAILRRPRTVHPTKSGRRGVIEFNPNSLKKKAKKTRSVPPPARADKRPRSTPGSRAPSAKSSPSRGHSKGGKVGAAEARINAARAKLLSASETHNFSGLGDNVLRSDDRDEIIRFKTEKHAAPPPGKPSSRKVLLHKCWQVNDAGQKIARVHIVMRLDYTKHIWELILLKKKNQVSQK